jgi:hypothetical protein
MLTDSLLRLGSESSVSERLVLKASSLRAQFEDGLKEAIYNMFWWVRDQPDRDLNGLMEEIDHLFLHSEGVYKCAESSNHSRSASPRAKAERLRLSDELTISLLTSCFLQVAFING